MADQAFMCSVLSLTPALFGVPIEQVLQQISLAQHINDALVTRKGRLGELLRVVEAMEHDKNGGDIEPSADLLPLGSHTLNQALAEALAWVNDMGKDPDADDASKDGAEPRAN